MICLLAFGQCTSLKFILFLIYDINVDNEWFAFRFSFFLHFCKALRTTPRNHQLMWTLLHNNLKILPIKCSCIHRTCLQSVEKRSLILMATNTVKSVARASNVYLFKNGYGMIVKTFEFPSKSESNEKNLELINLPSNAVHGTFWIQPTSDNGMSMIQIFWLVKINSIISKYFFQLFSIYP